MNAGEKAFGREMPRRAKAFAQIAQEHFKAGVVDATPSCWEEPRAILSLHHERHSVSPPYIDDIQFLFTL